MQFLVWLFMFVVLHGCYKEMTSSGQLLSSQALKASKSRRVSSVNTPSTPFHGNEHNISSYLLELTLACCFVM